jgi:hypothetical protein
MKRYFTWHRDSPRADGRREGPAYYADTGLGPRAIRLHAANAPNAGDLQVDIRDDGVSILTGFYARLTDGDTLTEEAEDYRNGGAPTIEEGSEVTFHIISTGGAEDITCTLELDEIDVDDE